MYVNEMKNLFEVAKGLKVPQNSAQETYHLLVFNRFYDFVETSFPLFSSLAEDELKSLIRDFLKLKHTYPILLGLGKEFVEFFRKVETPLKEKLPFLEELLIYEWTEIEVFNAPEEREAVPMSWEGHYRISKSARLLRFEYPVHKAEELSAEEILSGKGEYHLLIYRDREDEVKRTDLTPVVYRFLYLINSGETPSSALEVSDLGEYAEEARPYLERFLSELIALKVLIKK